MQFYPLKVSKKIQLTVSAISLSFELSDELYDIFDFKAGQYLSLKFVIDGKEYRRSYSLCSSPFLDEALQIGVKRVKDGKISNHIHDHIQVGDTIEVAPAQGRFFADVQEANYKSYYLFAAGSGITPIFSILKSVLAVEPHSYVYLFYGNRDEESVMFFDELNQLQEQHPDKLLVQYAYSKASAKWSDLWTSEKDKYFYTGRIDDKAIQWFINENWPYAQNAVYFICGPGSMIANTKASLQALDVPSNRIFKESFGGNASANTVKGVANAHLKAHINGQQIQTSIQAGQTVLRALIAAGADVPYSCEGGVCSSCKCKITKGEVNMKINLSLDEKEVAQGNILSCQSVPMSDEIEVVY